MNALYILIICILTSRFFMFLQPRATSRQTSTDSNQHYLYMKTLVSVSTILFLSCCLTRWDGILMSSSNQP